MTVFSGSVLEKKDGSTEDAETVVKNAKIVVLYFSAHWCPPCRGFTPVLKEFYEEEDVKKAGVCIIFVSSDRTEADMKSYFGNDHGDYYAVPFKDTVLIQTLKTNCQVSGIPALCVINKEGIMVRKDGRSDVTGNNPKNVVEIWGKIV